MNKQLIIQSLLENPGLTTAAFSRIVGEGNNQSELKYLLLALVKEGIVEFTENERGWKLWTAAADALAKLEAREARSVVLTDGGGKKAYLAKITGPHPKYKLDRVFCESLEVDGRSRRFRLPEAGVFEEVSYSAKGNQYRSFYEMVSGIKTELTQAEVEAKFGAPEHGQKPEPRVANGRCPECGLWLPAHEITCALIDQPYYGGQVEELHSYSVIGQGIDQ